VTAEIAILNKSAIAVAADSAVTVGRRKVHRYANKIFSVSDTAPIGLLVYGYGEYCGLPWETVVKVFRKELSNTKFLTVNQCYLAFRQFIASDRFFTEQAQRINLLLFSLAIVGHVVAAARKVPRVSDISSEIPDIIEICKLRYNRSTLPLTWDRPTLAAFRRAASSEVAFAVSERFKSIPGYKVPDRLVPKFTELVYSALTSSYRSTYSSGVAVFGFGDRELLPRLVHHEFDGSCFGSLRSIDRQTSPITQRNHAQIIPFAQRETMDLFMSGVSHKARRVISGFLHDAFGEISERIIKDNFTIEDDHYAVIRAINQKTTNEIMEKFEKKFSNWIREESVLPILKEVSNLPKEDMANLAEALVEVTAHKAKVTADVESVGGEIDVCVITKGDGLIWIKRKHYFDLEKNQHYLYTRFPQSRL
jgi:hypothetical protein